MKTHPISRLLILLIVAVLSLSFTTIASAATPKPSSAVNAGDIDGFSGKYELDQFFNLGQSGSAHGLVVKPGDEIRIPLTADMFSWKGSRSPLPMEAITLRELRSGRVRIKTKVRAGSSVLDYAQLNTDTFAGKPFFAPGQATKTGKTAYISVVFTDKFESIENVAFDFDISLTINNDPREMLIMSVAGEMEPYLTDISDNVSYVNLSDGSVAEASYNVRNVKMDLGNGVTVTKNVIEDKRYYGVAYFIDNMFMSREDFPDIYPLIHGVYELKTVNIKPMVNGVKIDPPIDNLRPEVKTFFVYDQDLKYIGTTADNLPYSDYYILTFEEIPTLNTSEYASIIERMPTSQRATPGMNAQGESITIIEEVIKPTIVVKYEKGPKGPNGADSDSIQIVEEYIYLETAPSQEAVKIVSGSRKVGGVDTSSEVVLESIEKTANTVEIIEETTKTTTQTRSVGDTGQRLDQ